jgi:hypothetical protein
MHKGGRHGVRRTALFGQLKSRDADKTCFKRKAAMGLAKNLYDSILQAPQQLTINKVGLARQLVGHIAPVRVSNYIDAIQIEQLLSLL